MEIPEINSIITSYSNDENLINLYRTSPYFRDIIIHNTEILVQRYRSDPQVGCNTFARNGQIFALKELLEENKNDIDIVAIYEEACNNNQNVIKRWLENIIQPIINKAYTASRYGYGEFTENPTINSNISQCFKEGYIEAREINIDPEDSMNQEDINIVIQDRFDMIMCHSYAGLCPKDLFINYLNRCDTSILDLDVKTLYSIDNLQQSTRYELLNLCIVMEFTDGVPQNKPNIIFEALFDRAEPYRNFNLLINRCDVTMDD